MLSFEFVPEQLDAAIACIKLLEGLAPGEYNVVLGEATRFQSDRWLSADDFIRDTLRAVPSTAFGDIYARFKT